MEKAIFKTIDEAASVMKQTGRAWTPYKVKVGFEGRANMPGGWRVVENIDVYHILNNGMYRVAA